MSYRRFNIAETANTPATVATVLPDQPRSVAKVASVARPDAISNTSRESSDVVDEREAMALEGGVPVAYARAFAELQVRQPDDWDEASWWQAIDDAGRFLDSHGRDAERKDWTALDLFGPAGLAFALKGRTVTTLSISLAVLSDGRTVLKHAPSRRAS